LYWREELRVAPIILLTNEQERELTRLARSKRTSVRLAQRAQIVLLAAQGLQNKDIAEQLGIGRVQVARWRERYLKCGLQGIEPHPHCAAGLTLRPYQPRKTMKKLNVTIKLEMLVPDDWVLAETSEGGQVLKLPNQQFLDLAIEPLFATNPEETWSSTEDDDALNDILDMVESEEVVYEFVTH
jgi:transposase